MGTVSWEDTNRALEKGGQEKCSVTGKWRWFSRRRRSTSCWECRLVWVVDNNGKDYSRQISPGKLWKRLWVMPHYSIWRHGEIKSCCDSSGKLAADIATLLLVSLRSLWQNSSPNHFLYSFILSKRRDSSETHKKASSMLSLATSSLSALWVACSSMWQFCRPTSNVWRKSSAAQHVPWPVL